MPITKTAKRALRSSERKRVVNKKIIARFEAAIRQIKKDPSEKNYQKAQTLIDRAVKNNIIHRNKASRIKSSLSKLLSKRVIKTSPKGKKRSSPKPKKK